MLLKPPLYDYCGGLNVGGSVLFIKGQVPFQCEFSILSNYVSARFFAYNGQLSLRPLLGSDIVAIGPYSYLIYQ